MSVWLSPTNRSFTPSSRAASSGGVRVSPFARVGDAVEDDGGLAVLAGGVADRQVEGAVVRPEGGRRRSAGGRLPARVASWGHLEGEDCGAGRHCAAYQKNAPSKRGGRLVDLAYGPRSTLPPGCRSGVALPGAVAPGPAPSLLPWTIHVVNDTCPDATWGFDEKATRRNMAELVRAHLDAMTRSDADPEWNRDRYTMAVTNEALAFLEQYPERKDELVRRLREGRMTLSPFLDNTLWGFQSEEAFLRSLYPARRLERAWGMPIDVAHHTELPSLPWGAATLLAGAGVRWLAVPFYDYDSEWGGLELPPLFVLEGPDGGRVRVVLDAWASRRHRYTQGRALLEDPKRIGAEFLPHLEALGPAYPFRDVTRAGHAR